MKKAIGVAIGFSAPFIGAILDAYLIHDTDLFSLPLTILGVLFIGLGYFMWDAFKRGALFATPTLFTETHRLNRFQDAIRIVWDGKIHWAIVPVGGFQYLKAFLAPKNFTQGRGKVAIMPARLLEAMGSRFHVGRVQLVELELNALKGLYQIQSFRRVFESFERFPTKLYLGIGSETLHPDSVDLKRADIINMAQAFSAGEKELRRVYRDLDVKLAQDLRKLERAQAKSDISKKITQAFSREQGKEEEK